MLGLQLGMANSVVGSSWALAALALFDDEPPNEQAVALAPQVGWLMLLGAIAVFALFIVHRESWRRWWLTAEDPRAIGLYRIVFGFFVICNINDLWEYFTFLFTDEGIFTADIARQVHASAQFAGFGDGFPEGEPWGFFDLHAVLEFLKGPKYSLLYIWDTPTFFWGHLWAFQICAVLFMIGFWTRTMGVLTFFLMNSIFFRNHLFWEGTELVYRVFLAYLICAKAGHAYSVDNWLRCRKLRKQGRLSERDGPGGGAGSAPSKEHPHGLQAVYRLIPAWPRRLAILQLATVYAFTGIVKNGSVWAKGDAVYYAWNMDHFYRFYPQQISAIFGTNLLRLATWFSHWGEVFFFLGVIGVLVHWAAAEKVPPPRGWRRVMTRVCWATIIGVSAAVIWVTWPVHFTPALGLGLAHVANWFGIALPESFVGESSRWMFVVGWVGLLAFLWWLWLRLDRKPVQVRGRTAAGLIWVAATGLPALLLYVLFPPHHIHRMHALRVGLAIGWIALALAAPMILRRIRGKGLWPDYFLAKLYPIDKMWVARWILGRRIWLVWHIMLMGGIFILMNIGHFQTGMLAQGLVFFTGYEVARALRFFGRRMGRQLAKRSAGPPLPSEDATLPHLRRDRARMPQWAMFAGLAVFLVGIFVKVKVQPQWEWRWIWVAGFVFLAGVAFQRWRASRGDDLSVLNPETGQPRTPWAYGPLGRFLVGSLLVWHITGVTVWLLPDKGSLSTWREPARQVFAKWLTVTQTDQGWGMFAPNPPRSNVFLRVLVHDEHGEVYDLKTDVYAPERKPIPWIWNDRMRKMNRRIIGGESGNSQWYRKWYARYVCRQWALDRFGLPGELGVSPKKVELVKVWYRIPSPEETASRGYYQPEELYERTKADKIEHTEHCKRTVVGQLPNWIRERHGLPPLPENEKYRPWIKHKLDKWEKRRAKERGEEPPPTDAETRKRAKAKD